MTVVVQPIGLHAVALYARAYWSENVGDTHDVGSPMRSAPSMGSVFHISAWGRQSASHASDFLLIPSSWVHYHNTDLVRYVKISLVARDFHGFALRIHVLDKFGVHPAPKFKAGLRIDRNAHHGLDRIVPEGFQ